MIFYPLSVIFLFVANLFYIFLFRKIRGPEFSTRRGIIIAFTAAAAWPVFVAVSPLAAIMILVDESEV